MLKRKPKVLTQEQAEEIRTKDFFDMILPGTIKFLSDHYILGDSYRCVWAIREYPPSTEEQAILSQLADRSGVTLRIYHRLVESMEQRKIIQNATRRNKLKSGGTDVNETIEAEGNLQDVVELLANLRKNREPLLHCSVFIELKARNMDALKELQSEIAMELTRSKISVDRLTLRQKEGFLSVLPVGANQFGAQYERVLPASSVANLYPFNFSGKTDPRGIYIGRDKFGTNILVDFDRRAEDKTTSNILILGNSGQGKSYLLKLILTNLRESGKRIISLDLIAYSTAEGQGYLSPKGVNALRSSFAKDIFAQDLISVYEKQTEHRDALRINSREVIAEIVSKINSGVYDNPKLEEMLLHLSDRLSKTSSKKVYGYLKADVKAIIDSIVDELAADERISMLYDLWYEQRENIIRTYTDEEVERIPLSQNKEFKSIKNAVIQEAMNIVSDRTLIEDEEEQTAPDHEPSYTETEPALTDKEKASLMWINYSKAKKLLDKESDNYNPNKAVEYLIESAKLGCGVAKYRLGKMFLHGDEVTKNVDYALMWLEESVSEKNQYAEYLLGKTYLKGEDVEQDLNRAENLLRRSSAQNNRYAKYTLGKNLLNGELFLQNISESIKLITESAESCFAPAQYLLGKLLYRGEVIPQDLEKSIDYLEKAAAQKNPYAAYLAGKLRLTEDAVKDIRKAICNFEIAAENGNDYAEYQLGKIYLFGKYVNRDYDKAIVYLTSSAKHGNQYGAQLLHSIKANRNWFATIGSLRLLGQISRMIQNRLDDEHKGKIGTVDRKLKRIIYEKKQAHGLH